MRGASRHAAIVSVVASAGLRDISTNEALMPLILTIAVGIVLGLILLEALPFIVAGAAILLCAVVAIAAAGVIYYVSPALFWVVLVAALGWWTWAAWKSAVDEEIRKVRRSYGMRTAVVRYRSEGWRGVYVFKWFHAWPMLVVFGLALLLGADGGFEAFVVAFLGLPAAVAGPLLLIGGPLWLWELSVQKAAIGTTNTESEQQLSAASAVAQIRLPVRRGPDGRFLPRDSERETDRSRRRNRWEV